MEDTPRHKDADQTEETEELVWLSSILLTKILFPCQDTRFGRKKSPRPGWLNQMVLRKTPKFRKVNPTTPWLVNNFSP